MTLFTLLIILAVVVLPGWEIARYIAPDRGVVERAIWACGIGTAVAIYTLFLCSFAAIHFTGPLLISIYLLLRFQRHRQDVQGLSFETQDALLILMLAAALIPRLFVSSFHELPPGWDPSFHLILVRKILESGTMIFDWSPFEEIPLNYPVGSHLLIAAISHYSSVPPHVVFNFMIPLLGALSVGQVYLFAFAVCGTRPAALYAAAAYGLWAVYGSIDYYRWGGMPNLVGMLFLMQVLTILSGLRERATQVEYTVIALLGCAIMITHHHVMITSFAILGALATVWLVRPTDRGRAIHLIRAAFGATILGAGYLIPYLYKSATIGTTKVLIYKEEYYDLPRILESVGTLFFFASIVGVFVYVSRRGWQRYGALSWVPALTLGVLFVLFEYGYRWYARTFLGGDFVAFTPSRFISDMVYFSAVYVGLLVAEIEAVLRRYIGASRLAFVVPGVMILLGAVNIDRWKAQSVVEEDAEKSVAYRWIAENVPTSTIVLNTNEEKWCTYIAWRRCLKTPIPISESLPRETPRMRLIADVREGKIAEELRGILIVEIVRVGTRTPGTELLWKSGAFEVRGLKL